MYRVFKHQVGFLKVAQIRALWTKLCKSFFSDFLKMVNFCQVTKQKDFYSVLAAAGAEMWKRKITFYTFRQCNVLFCLKSFNKQT